MEVHRQERAEREEHMSPEEERLAFNSELGRAISEWAHVEYLLGIIVSKCAREGSQPLLLKGYLSIENLRSKLQFSDTVVQHALGDTPNIDDWAPIRDRIRSLSTKRNKLVHRMVYSYRDADAGKRFALEEVIPRAEPEPKKRPKAAKAPPPIKPSSGAIFLMDIARARIEFFALSVDLARYLLKIDGRPVMPPEFDEPDWDRPTIQKTRNRNRAALGLPPLPLRKKPKQEQEPSS